MSDYERIAEVIRYLQRNHQEQPGLDDLARRVGLSPSHFHRLFVRWAGTTPKEFLQVLTFEHARIALLQGDSVLDAALSAGLSGPGRLHDVCVSLEAASPGEIKNGGEGLEIVYGEIETPFGDGVLAETSRGICHLSFGEALEIAESALRKTWLKAKLKRDDRASERLAKKVFRQDAEANRSLRVWVKGTIFQLRVWRALLAIPEANFSTYGRIAKAVGVPQGSRAVGQAVGSNPVAYLIPCHRVIRESGLLGGYRWGIERKTAILARERINAGSEAVV